MASPRCGGDTQRLLRHDGSKVEHDHAKSARLQYLVRGAKGTVQPVPCLLFTNAGCYRWRDRSRAYPCRLRRLPVPLPQGVGLIHLSQGKRDGATAQTVRSGQLTD